MRIQTGLLAALMGMILPSMGAPSGYIAPQGGEFGLTLRYLGEQVKPALAFDAEGGYIAWQDNITDQQGLGLSMQILDQSLRTLYAPVRVNEITDGDQENVQLAMLADGGAVLVWQSGPQGGQDIMVRILGPDGTFLSSEQQVNEDDAHNNTLPVVKELSNGNIAIAWVSEFLDQRRREISVRLVDSEGNWVSDSFRANLNSNLNQQSPDLLALDNGEFMVAWSSENFQQVADNTDESGVRVAGMGGLKFNQQFVVRKFNAAGQGLTLDIVLTGDSVIAANPRMARMENGKVFLTGSWRSAAGIEGQWEVMGLTANEEGEVLTEAVQLNQHSEMGQYAPRVAAVGGRLMVVWTSQGQDTATSYGIFGRVLDPSGNPDGDEFQINEWDQGNQIHPAVAADQSGRVLVVWSGYMGAYSFDLFGRHYLNGEEPLTQPAAPFVNALSPAQISVTWPEFDGLEIAQFELYVDDSVVPVVLETTKFVHEPLAPESDHTYRLAYRVEDGRVSPVSEAAVGTTWGSDLNFDGLPDNWQTRWGSQPSQWPGSREDSDGDGASNLQEFLAGTDPQNPESYLKVTIQPSDGGFWFSWNAQPGGTYQLQASDNLSDWADYGEPRFAVDETDAVQVTGGNGAAYFRVIKFR